MDFKTFDILVRILQVVVLPVLGILIKLLMDQRKQISSLEGRMTEAEVCLKNAPTEKTLHELALNLRAFAGDLHVTVEKIEGMGRIVDRLERVVTRHEEFLLNGGK